MTGSHTREATRQPSEAAQPRWTDYVAALAVVGALVGAVAWLANAEPEAPVLPPTTEQQVASSGLETVGEDGSIGDGAYRVGLDIEPGSYSSPDNTDCSWQISTDADGGDVLQDETVSGPALVTLNEGTFFKTQGCNPWVRQ